MKKIIFVIVVLISLIIPQSLHASALEDHKRIFISVTQVVEKRFSSQDQERFYSQLATMIDTLLVRNTQTPAHKTRLLNMQSLAREKLFEMQVDKNNNSNTQRITELRIRNS